MVATSQRPDVLVLVPFQPMSAYAVDPVYRQTLGAHLGMRIGRAISQFEEDLGRSVSLDQWKDNDTLSGGVPEISSCGHRSLTAVTLATHLERAGLKWEAIDPGVQELRYWRLALEKYRHTPPRVVGLSTTFVMSGPWLQAMCALVRRILPDAQIVVGGSFYSTSAREFLSLDADVFCLGEGELRFPEIVRKLCDGRSLADIPGLYLRGDAGRLEFTGHSTPLKLDQLPLVDWQLAHRISPRVDFEQVPSYYYVETQRGCKFRCEFCTYHTLTPHDVMDIERSVQSIRDTGIFPHGYAMLVDATATFPRDRWHAIVQRLAEVGGSPHPLMLFARVTDISEETAALMARAGVHEVFVGQESGDQRILNAMKKGTRIEHVGPAIRALGRHGIGAQFCMIHGFPGESPESIANMRHLLATLNQDFADNPVAYCFTLTPFHAFDFATISQYKELRATHHPVGYDTEYLSPQLAAEEVLGTVISTSRVPHAPVASFLFEGQGHFLFTVRHGPQRPKVFRWLKAMQRGVAIFMESDLEGKSPDLAELRAVRETVLAQARPRGGWRTRIERVGYRIKGRQCQRIQASWSGERERGPDSLTRGFLAMTALRDLGRFSDAVHSYRTATYPPPHARYAIDTETIDQLSNEMITHAVRQRMKEASFEQRQASSLPVLEQVPG